MAGRFPRPIHLGVAAVAGVAIGGTAAYLWARRQIPTDSHHPALKHGAPTTTHFRIFSSYVAEYDPRLRNPRYVLEHFTPEVLQGDGNRQNSRFTEDRGIESRFRATLNDFKNSGYDRGHMAPAANHKRSQQAMNDTFILTNVCPQVGVGFNRDYWARFEKFIQDVAKRSKDVYVVTGPLYLPVPEKSGGWKLNSQMLGTPPRMVAVPSHFYKVVLGEGGGDPIVGAFVIPNTAIDHRIPLSSFAVPLSALEEVAGISFFPKFLNNSKRAAIDEVSLQWQHSGYAEMAQLKLTSGKQPLLPLLPPPVGAGKLEEQVPNWKPQKLGNGMRHICEDGCRLPPEKWWEASYKAEKEKKAALRRTQSSPVLLNNDERGGGGNK